MVVLAMTVRVKLFAVLRDVSGVAEFSLDLAPPATVAEAVGAIAGRYPALSKYLGRAAAAVNLVRVPVETVLNEGDELALLPPVSGG
jgi:molybdopterin converting factor small subunit